MINFDKIQVKWGKFINKGAFGKVYEVEYKGQKYAGKKIPELIIKKKFDGSITARNLYS